MPSEPDHAVLQDWLADLRDGIEPEKIVARRGLARVFERRRMLDEAIDLLLANVRAGARDVDTCGWLARLYRAQGNTAGVARMATQAALARAAAPRTPAPSNVVRSVPTRPRVPTATPANRRVAVVLVVVLVLLLGGAVLGRAVGGALFAGGTFKNARQGDAEAVSEDTRDDLLSLSAVGKPGDASGGSSLESFEALASAGNLGVDPPGLILPDPPDRELTRHGVGDVQAEPFFLAGGDYRVAWHARKQPNDRECTFVAALQSKPGSSPIVFKTLRLPKATGENEGIGGETTVTGLAPGEYRITGAGTTCSWSVSIAPSATEETE